MSTSLKIQNTNNINISQQQILPITHPNNYFQNWSNVHLSIRTGLCGCLTTFASWNTQMVTMIGTGNISIIIQALFGYIVGMHCSYMSLKFGQHLSIYIYYHYHSNTNDNRQLVDVT